MTLPDSEIIDLWIEKHHSDLSRRHYKEEWQRFCQWREREQLPMPLSSIKAMEIQRYINERQVMASTQRKILVTFRSLYSFAKHCGFTGVSAPHLMRCPRRNQTIHERILSDENLATMLGHAKSKRDEMIV